MMLRYMEVYAPLPGSPPPPGGDLLSPNGRAAGPQADQAMKKKTAGPQGRRPIGPIAGPQDSNNPLATVPQSANILSGNSAL